VRRAPVVADVSHHIRPSVDLSAILRVFNFVFAFAVFAYLIARRSSLELTAERALLVGLAFVCLSLLIQFVAPHGWHGFGPWLSMDRETLGVGTGSLAIGYGTLGYALLRVLLPKKRKGDG
jgi:hypothetical protein